MSLPNNVSLLEARRNQNVPGQALGDTVDSLSRQFLGAGAAMAADPAYLKQLGARPYRGVTLLRRSLSDGISFTQTAMSALGDMQERLGEMQALADQSLNLAADPQERLQLNEAFRERCGALRPLVEETAFAGKRMLSSDAGGMTFQVGSEAGQTLTMPGFKVDLSRLGETAWQVLIGGRPRPAPQTQAGPSAAGTALSIQGVDVPMEGVTSLAAVVDAINALAEETGVTATRAEGNPIWLWRSKEEATDEPPRVGKGSAVAASLGLGAYQVDPDFRLALQDSSIATWGDAAHALKTIGKAIAAIEPIHRQYDYLAVRFAAVVEFAEAEAELHNKRGRRTPPEKRARAALEQARALVLEQPSYAARIQGNSTSSTVLSLLGAR